MAKAKLQCRIRYEDKGDKGEWFIFENKWTTEDEWGLDIAFKCEDDKISYQALTKVRELLRQGIEIIWK